MRDELAIILRLRIEEVLPAGINKDVKVSTDRPAETARHISRIVTS